jgi:hypothetical protein
MMMLMLMMQAKHVCHDDADDDDASKTCMPWWYWTNKGLAVYRVLKKIPNALDPPTLVYTNILCRCVPSNPTAMRVMCFSIHLQEGYKTFHPTAMRVIFFHPSTRRLQNFSSTHMRVMRLPSNPWTERVCLVTSLLSLVTWSIDEG